MPRPNPATPRVAHRFEAMPRPNPATPRVAHHPEATPRPSMSRPQPAERAIARWERRCYLLASKNTFPASQLDTPGTRNAASIMDLEGSWS